ncbi:hypothetical protein FB451DRAFT_131880 [Mycena latifolia]|nr:hypothetical protein FB451DRAFT_131880 [Mycena latifolia]
MENTTHTGAIPLCLHFAQGFCPYGLSCRFYHPPASDNNIHFPSYFRPVDPFASQQEMTVATSSPSQLQYTQPIDGTNVDATSAKLAFLERFKPLSWRTTPCRHFIKHKGWCPLGDSCGFIHDLSLPNSELQVGKSHCWLHVSSTLGLHHPEMPLLSSSRYCSVKHTPCPSWAMCSGNNGCPFKHPEALHVRPTHGAVPPNIGAAGTPSFGIFPAGVARSPSQHPSQGNQTRLAPPPYSGFSSAAPAQRPTQARRITVTTVKDLGVRN